MRRALLRPRHPPLDWEGVITFLAHRAVAGVELVDSGTYRRTIRCDGQSGTLHVAYDDAHDGLLVTVYGLRGPAADAAVERVKWMFDLDADLPVIRAHLERDTAMARLLASRPATRVFRGWDAFEVAARSVIGQQVTVTRARQLNGTLVGRCGSLVAQLSPTDGLDRLFPTPEEISGADLSAMGMPAARVAALRNIGAAAMADPQLFTAAASIAETIARLRAIGGIGDWTAHYIAMRACGEPDAFPASDVGLLRGAADATGKRPAARELLERAERWRPWRAYAAHLLWAVEAGNLRADQI